MIRKKLGLERTGVAHEIGVGLGRNSCGIFLIFSFDGVADIIRIEFGQRHKFGMRLALKGRVEQQDNPNGSDRRED